MQSEIQNLVTTLVAVFVPFLPVLFGAVEFIKAKTGLEGRAVEALSAGLFVFFGLLVVVAYFFPVHGVIIVAVILFLVMCALAPSGYYKFINARAPGKDGNG